MCRRRAQVATVALSYFARPTENYFLSHDIAVVQTLKFQSRTNRFQMSASIRAAIRAVIRAAIRAAV